MADTLFKDATSTIPGTPLIAAWHNDVNADTYNTLSSVVGTDTIVASGPVSLTAYASFQQFFFVPTGTNTGAATININGLGVKSITKNGATPLGAGDIVSGKTVLIAYDGTQFQLLNPSILATNGILPVAKGGTGLSITSAVGQCQLTKSGANIVLLPYKGSVVPFPAGNAVLPSAGVSLAPTGLTVGTLYYIYGVQTAGVVTSLEASTTVPVTDSTTGIRVQTGDATRRLQGMVRPITGPAFQDTVAQRFVVSWDNPRIRNLSNALASPTNLSNTTFAELGAGAVRIEFLTWAASVSVNASYTFINTGANNCSGAIAYDGIVGEDGSGFAQGSNIYNSISASSPKDLAEGYHYACMVVRQVGGTTTWQGQASATERCSIVGTIVG